MMVPPFCERNIGANSRQPYIALFKFSFIARSISSTDMSAVSFIATPPPALFTSRSSLPNFSRMNFPSLSQSSGRVASAANGMAPVSSAASASVSFLLPVMTTRQPASAKRFAAAFP